MSNESEINHLLRAVELADDNVQQGGRPFGAVVAHGGAVLAEGVNRVDLTSDPTTHAEAEAIRTACGELGILQLSGAVVYASGEPCVMCQAIAHSIGVAEMVYALPATAAAAAGWPTSAESARLHRAWSQASDGFTRHVAVPGAVQPVERWVAGQADGL